MDVGAECEVPMQEEPAATFPISDLSWKILEDLCEEANPAKVPQNPDMEDSGDTEEDMLGAEDLKLNKDTASDNPEISANETKESPSEIPKTGRSQWLPVPPSQIFCPEPNSLAMNAGSPFRMLGMGSSSISQWQSMSSIITSPKSLGIVMADTEAFPTPRQVSRTSSKMISKPLRAENLILDVNTANNLVLISDDGKMASWTYENLYRPETPLRFHIYPQVLSCQSFALGQHFWDVDVGLSYSWRVGMCYPSMDRGGWPGSALGNNEQSWSLNMDGDQYSAGHAGKMTELPNYVSSDKVGIYLDYEAGQLSFYELRDPHRHLHTFTATFTEPLHVIVCVWEGSVRVSGGAERGKGVIWQRGGM